MNILFICTGNTCRSCMAEAIFNELNEDEILYSAKSAGISIVSNSKTSKNAALVIKEDLGIDISNRYAVQLTDQIIKQSDLILAMTENIKKFLINNFPNFKDKVYNLNEYVGVKGEIFDPYGGTIAVYRHTYEQLKSNNIVLLHKLKEDKSIH